MTCRANARHSLCGADVSNILIGDRNWFASATLSGGSWNADWPLTKLQSDDLSAPAISADDLKASAQFQWDFGAAKSVDAFAMAAHNLTTSALVKLSLGTTAGASDVHAGGWVSAYSVTDADRNGISHMVVVPFLAAKSARYGKLEIDDESNPDGRIEIGYVWCGEGFRPTYNAVYGLQDQIIDASEVDRMYNGRRVNAARRRWRGVSFVLEVLSHAESARAHEMQRRYGVTEPLLYLPNPASAETCQRYGFIGTAEELSPIEYPFFNNRRVALRLEEL